MPTIADAGRLVTGGVDTHAEVHVAGVGSGQPGAGDRGVPGHRGRLCGGAGLDARHGELVKVGVEGTGSYGAGLARYLAAEGIEVAEVIRPNRQAGVGAASRIPPMRSPPRWPHSTARRRGSQSPVTARWNRSGPAGGPPRRGQGPHPGRQPARRPDRHRPRRCGRSWQACLRASESPWLPGSAPATSPARPRRPGPHGRRGPPPPGADRRDRQLDTALETLAGHAAPAGFLARKGVGTQVAARCWSPPATTLAACAPTRASPRCAAPARSTPPPASSAATASTAVGTGKPTPPVADRLHPDGHRPAHSGLRGPAHQRRQDHQGDHALPQALRRPRGLQGPDRPHPAAGPATTSRTS